MKKLLLSLGGASVAMLLLVGAALATGPGYGGGGDQLRDRDRDRDRDHGAIPAVLGLTQAQVMELRHDGLSLAQIAERERVDPQELVDALRARWAERIELRLASGAITADRAAELQSQLTVQARNMVYQTTEGGMRGAAIGAGPQSGSPAGQGPHGTAGGTCDGTGRG